MLHVIVFVSTVTSVFACSASKSEISTKMSAKQRLSSTDLLDTITLGGGCFWCVEAIYEQMEGVYDVKSGYSGGKTDAPTYEQVCTGRTGHAEVVQVLFDTSIVQLEQVLEVFFRTHDPTTLNRQGADVGTQYRSVVFYHSEQQRVLVNKVIEKLGKAKIYPSKIVTEVAPFERFFDAENYHQNYYENNSDQQYCRIVIQPKLEKFEKLFASFVRKK